MPDDSITELVELTSLSNIQAAGNYQVLARVRYNGRFFTARPKGFDVAHGIEIMSLERALRGYEDIRLTYSLRYASRSSSEQAFLMVEDRGNEVSYGTFQLGPSLRVSAPIMRFDDEGRVVIVHQSGRNRYTRSVVLASPEGASLVSQSHFLPDGKPYPQSGQNAPRAK